MQKTIVSRTYGSLHQGRHSARQDFYFIKYILIKTLKIIKMTECILHTLMHRYVHKYYAEY